MKVTIKNINGGKEQVIIECEKITPDIEDIRSYAESKGTSLCGTADGERQERFELEQICYFEAVDEKVFAYTDKKVYQIKQRLYEVEQTYAHCHFARCSKSAVINLMLLESISPALNGRFFAHMKNGEKIIISRQYAKEVKKRVFATDN